MTKIRILLRTFVPALAIAALLTEAAYAQGPGILAPKMSLQGDEKHLTPEEQEKKKELDDAYKAATSKIPDQTTTNDPWATVRPAPSAPAPKKTPKTQQTQQ
jgi:hypothetical protein